MSFENLNQSSEIRKRPGDPLRRDQMWNPRVDQRSGTPVGYDDPEGNFHSLKLGESIVIERNQEAGKYSVQIQSKDGTVKVLEEGDLGVGKTEQHQETAATSIERLPPLKEGYLRLVHITDQETAGKIKSSGLNYSGQGMITSTARVWSKAEDCEYFSDDPRYSFAGAVAVVMDVPADEVRLHNNVAQSPGTIPAEYLVGIVDAKKIN